MMYHEGDYITRTIESPFNDNDVLVGLYRVTAPFECTTKITAWEVMGRDDRSCHNWGHDFFKWLESCGFVEVVPFHDVATYDRGDDRCLRVRG